MRAGKARAPPPEGVVWKSCKPSFVFPVARGENHLSKRRYPEPGSVLRPGLERAAPQVPYLALHPMGFSVPRALRIERWALTPPFHPCRTEARRFVFCGTVRRRAFRLFLPRVSPPKRGYAASRSVVFGLSSLPACARRAILRFSRPSQFNHKNGKEHRNKKPRPAPAGVQSAEKTQDSPIDRLSGIFPA